MSKESKATWTFGRFNPPTESGHGKLVDAVVNHAKKTGGEHYIFPSHSQDKKKNPLSHDDKVGAMRKIFPHANVVSHEGVRDAIGAMKHLEKKGHSHVTMVVGSDRVPAFHKLLNDYNGKEYNFKKIEVKSAGHRDPDAEGSEGMSASKLRGLVSQGKRDEFVSHYSNKKVGAEIHDKVKAAMMKEARAIFLFGGPGSGKDYLINNIFNHFGLTEVQLDQVLLESFEACDDILINCTGDLLKVEKAKEILEGYSFSHILVSVTNQVSRQRNDSRTRPLDESVRIRKWLDTEKLEEQFDNCFKFKNSINLNRCTEIELLMFQEQIENTLKFMLDNGYNIQEVKNPVAKNLLRFNKPKIEKSKKKYQRSGKHKATMDEKIKEPTGKLKDACWKGYTAVGMKMKNGRKVPNCVPVKEAYEEGTDEAREHAESMTPGQSVIDPTPTLKTKGTKANKGKTKPISDYNAKISGSEFMAPGNNLVQEKRLGFKNYVQLKEATISEAVEYHLTNNIPISENVFRPGSDKFFELMLESKKLFSEGKYSPIDDYEADMLRGDIGEFAEYNGELVPLDFPFLEEESSDPTKGKGIGKPWREGGGGAVYVKDGDKVKKVRFSQSGMEKKYNDPARLKSFMARHNCLGNTDKTGAAYWACRWPRFFSKSGQLWW